MREVESYRKSYLGENMLNKKKERIKYIEILIHESLSNLSIEIQMENKKISDINKNNGLFKSGHHIQSIINTDSKMIKEGLNNSLDKIFKNTESRNLKLKSIELNYIQTNLIEHYTRLVERFIDENRNDQLEASNTPNSQVKLIKDGTIKNVQNIVNSRINKYRSEHLITSKSEQLKAQISGNRLALLSLVVSIISLVISLTKK